MKRKSFVLRKYCKNNMFTKEKRVQSSYNLFLKKYLYTVNEKNILIQSMEKEKNNYSEIFPIVYIVSCRSISSYPSPSRSTSLTDFLHVAIYYS